jgi:hypothetical protein
MNFELGPINKGKYWRTEFDGLEAIDLIMYNNGYEQPVEMEYYLVRRFSDEDENEEGKTFIGKDYVVQVTTLDSTKVIFFAVYDRRVYVDEEGKESFERWDEAFSVNVAGSYMNEYEYEGVTQNFTFTKEQVNSGVDADGAAFELYQMKEKPQVPKESILLPSMKPLRNAIVEEEGPVAAVGRIENIVAAQARNRRRHILMAYSKKKGGKRQKTSIAHFLTKRQKTRRHTLKKRHSRSRRNGLRKF